MSEATELFERSVARNCPSNAACYYLERVGKYGEPLRHPIDRALRVEPFEWPVGAKAGQWIVRYCSDEKGGAPLPNIGGTAHVIATLSYPAEVCEQPAGATDAELMAALTKEVAEVDDDEGSLKAARIEAKKRELAIGLTAKEQKLARRAAVNKELSEGYLLNRAHRMEVRDSNEAMFRVGNQTLANAERTLLLVEKVQEALGRVAELEREVARRAATPPPPVDYSPVLNSVVGAIRDIGVSALQRDQKSKPKSEEESTPVKAGLTEASTPATLAPKAPTAPLLAESMAPTLPSSSASGGQQSITELLAERDRLRAELAERTKTAQQTGDSAPSPHEFTTPTPASAASPAQAAEQQALAELRAERDRLREQVERQTKAELQAEQERLRAELAERSKSAPSLMPRALPAHDSPGDVHGQAPPSSSVSRNAPCPCRSGKKYKKCCLGRSRSAEPQAAPANTAIAAAPSVPEMQLAVTGTPSSTNGPDSHPQSVPAELPPATANVLPLQSGPAVPEQQLQELLVNVMAGRMLSGDSAIAPPSVHLPKQVEQVVVDPPTMDRETALRLLKDGTAIEALGAFLFFNPAVRTALLNLKGK